MQLETFQMHRIKFKYTSPKGLNMQIVTYIPVSLQQRHLVTKCVTHIYQLIDSEELWVLNTNMDLQKFLQIGQISLLILLTIFWNGSCGDMT